MRTTWLLLSALLTLPAPALAADADFECVFKSPSGSVISFAGDEDASGHGHVTVDGVLCTYEAQTSITCGSRTDKMAPDEETIDFRGETYVSTDHCSAGPE